MRASFLSRSVTGCMTLLLVGGMGCTPPKIALTPAGEHVKLSKLDAPGTCREVGTVESNEQEVEPAKFKLRNAAAEQGANYVRWDSIKGNYVLMGTTFQCPPEALE